MCGICGYILPDEVYKNIGKQKIQDFLYQYIYKSLINLSSKRGTDGTGIAFIGEDGTIKCYKNNTAALAFVQTKEFTDMRGNMPRVLIGHVRKISRGASSYTNTHPILYKQDYALVHNGTVNNVEALKKDLAKHYTPKTNSVDTRVVLNYIIESIKEYDLTPEEAIHNLNYEAHGGMACAMLEAKTKNLYLWRGVLGTRSSMDIVWHLDKRIFTFLSDERFYNPPIKNKTFGWGLFQKNLEVTNLTAEIADNTLIVLNPNRSLKKDINIINILPYFNRKKNIKTIFTRVKEKAKFPTKPNKTNITPTKPFVSNINTGASIMPPGNVICGNCEGNGWLTHIQMECAKCQGHGYLLDPTISACNRMNFKKPSPPILSARDLLIRDKQQKELKDAKSTTMEEFKKQRTKTEKSGTIPPLLPRDIYKNYPIETVYDFS